MTKYTKTINTLLDDINSIFTDPEHKISKENLDLLSEGLAYVLRDHIESAGNKSKPYLRMSNIGLPDRRLWLDINTYTEHSDVSVDPALQMTFLLGHVLEQVIIFLIRESGHTVEDTQSEQNVDGVLGHMDLRLDGVPTDIKTVSPFFVSKFVSVQALRSKDSFGYIYQLAAYLQACKDQGLVDPNKVEDVGAILAVNKSSGKLQLLTFDDMDIPNVKDRIAHTKAILSSNTLPPICYEPVPRGKSGNEVINSGCRYCKHKFKCFDNLRVFQYKNGLEYFTKVEKLPQAEEITHNFQKIKESETKELEEAFVCDV